MDGLLAPDGTMEICGTVDGWGATALFPAEPTGVAAWQLADEPGQNDAPPTRVAGKKMAFEVKTVKRSLIRVSPVT